MSWFDEHLGANRVVVALSTARLADAFGNSILFIVLPLYVAKVPSSVFHLPLEVLVGLLISMYGILNSLFQPLLGALSDHFGRRKPVILGGLFLMGIGTLGFIAAHHFTDLLLLRMLQGIGVAATVPASLALMTSATTQDRRGGAMGVYTTMRMTGFAVGPLVGGVLVTHYGFNTTFLTGAASIFLSLILVAAWVREPAGTKTVREARPRFRVFDRSLLTPGILGVASATFFMACSFMLMTTLENEFNRRLHETAIGFSIAFSAVMVARLLFQVPLGRLSDHVGRKPLILVGLAVMAPATALLGLAGSTLQLTLLRVLQGLGSAGVAAPAFALAGDLAKSGGEGRQLSLVTMGFGLGMAVGPLLAGVLAVVFFELPFIVGGVLLLIGGWVVYRFVPETVARKAAVVDD